MYPFQFTVGADPEVFLIRKEIPVSAIGLIPGTKDEPSPMIGLAKGFCVQADNVACEFNIPPATTSEIFEENITKARNYIKKLAGQHRAQISTRPAINFPESELEHPAAKRFGCDPDVNVWTMESNPSPNTDTTLRTVAGHVHIGYPQSNVKTSMLIGRLFDAVVTLPSLFVTDPSLRRTMYGAAGACRFKPYGIECRSLESFWIERRSHIRTVWKGVSMVMDMLMDTKMHMVVQDLAGMIVESINHHDLELAEMVLEHYPHVSFEKRVKQ